jgi:hypothetical protein
MKKFFTKLAVIAFIVGACDAAAMLAVWMLPYDKGAYLAAAIDKHRMLDSIAPPRIILIGGSNVPFNYNSAMMSDAFHLPVVNMGLHANVGLRYMLHEVAPALGKGDLAVVFPEYGEFFDKTIDGGYELAWLLTSFPQGFRYLSSPGQWLTVFCSFGHLIPGKVRYCIQAAFGRYNRPDVYSRASFENGNITDAQRGQGKAQETFDIYIKPMRFFNKETLRELNAFAKKAERAGATCSIIFPVTTSVAYEKHRKEIGELTVRLENDSRVTILHGAGERCLPPRYFFDSPFHLSSEGRNVETACVIDIIRKSRMVGHIGM